MRERVINICAPSWERAESYGRIARELTQQLHRRGYHVNTLGHEAPVRLIRPALGGVLLAYPTNFHAFGALPNHGPRLAVTMFESTALPPGWAEALNACDGVIVPSTWLVDVFKAAGVTAPIRVVPLGVSNAFKPVRRAPTTGRPYRFLCIGDRGKRKGWHVALAAFEKAFGRSTDVELVVKVRPGVEPFHSVRLAVPNIRVDRRELSDRQLATLYATADCMVFPTAGEGFGLPPREFAATGGVVIATDFAGTRDGLPDWGLPLGYRMVPAWQGVEALEGTGEWAEPRVDELAEMMRFVYEQRETSWLREYGERASAFVRTEYTWGRFGKAVREWWEELTDGHQ